MSRSMGSSKTVNGKDYCHNTYGMTVNDNSICYTDKDNKIKNFLK